MISRVAESCFWLTRYLERVDTFARLLEVNQTFQLDVDLPSAERWRPLVVVSGSEEAFLERVGADAIDDAEAVQAYLTWDEEEPSSIHSFQASTVSSSVSLHCSRSQAWHPLSSAVPVPATAPVSSIWRSTLTTRRDSSAPIRGVSTHS